MSGQGKGGGVEDGGEEEWSGPGGVGRVEKGGLTNEK